ncbi:FIST C-terminal domain-containing protein [Patescibacteria group bacterium]|nr:FIST C-terminal domain-containing protein [Patescibacteria group bacterium]
MSTKATVGFSQDANAKKAGNGACSAALENLKNAKLLIVFASSSYNQEELVSAIKEIGGDIPMIGCSTAGEITDSGIHKDSVAIMAIESDEINFIAADGGSINSNPLGAGARLAKEIIKKAGGVGVDAVLMLVDVLSGNGADAVRGVRSVTGDDMLIIGGAAGDNFEFKQTTQYCNNQALPSSIVGAGIVGSKVVAVGVKHGWVPIGTVMEITKSEGAVLQEINGKPAIYIYEEYFGKKAEELREEPLAKMAITYPLGIFIEGSKEMLIRDAITVDENGAMTCAAEVPVGSKVRLMIGNKEEAIKAAKEAAEKALSGLEGKEPAAAVIFNCIARQKLFGRHANDEIEAIKSVLGKDVPIIGFYTYGEIAPFNEANVLSCRFHNETVVVMVIAK